MRIIAVENTEDDLNMLRSLIDSAFPGSQCRMFRDPLLAIKAYYQCPADLTIFRDKMRIIDGFTFVRSIRCSYAGFTGVMLADNESGRWDAVNYRLEYLVRPADADGLKQCYERICSNEECDPADSGPGSPIKDL